MEIGEKLKLNRENKKLTQKDVALMLNVEPSTICKYESNSIEPNIESLKKLSKIFGISIDELVSNDDEKINISKINILEVLKEQKDMKLKGNLYHNTQIAFTYNTNHIEGSTLTEEQTRYIFETNTILFKSETVANVNDIIETTNHFKLIDYMIDIASEELTQNMIKNFHEILKSGTSDSKKEWVNVGEYKSLANKVGGLNTVSLKDVEKNMKKLLDWYKSLEKITINEIIRFHAEFEKIHPFQDGNGRVGRIIAFKECLKNNIVPFIILDKDKLFYYRGINEYQTNKEKGYLSDTILNAQDQYEKMIREFLS